MVLGGNSLLQAEAQRRGFYLGWKRRLKAKVEEEKEGVHQDAPAPDRQARTKFVQAPALPTAGLSVFRTGRSRAWSL